MAKIFALLSWSDPPSSSLPRLQNPFYNDLVKFFHKSQNPSPGSANWSRLRLIQVLPSTEVLWFSLDLSQKIIKTCRQPATCRCSPYSRFHLLLLIGLSYHFWYYLQTHFLEFTSINFHQQKKCTKGTFVPLAHILSLLCYPFQSILILYFIIKRFSPKIHQNWWFFRSLWNLHSLKHSSPMGSSRNTA